MIPQVCSHCRMDSHADNQTGVYVNIHVIHSHTQIANRPGSSRIFINSFTLVRAQGNYKPAKRFAELPELPHLPKLRKLSTITHAPPICFWRRTLSPIPADKADFNQGRATRDTPNTCRYTMRLAPRGLPLERSFPRSLRIIVNCHGARGTLPAYALKASSCSLIP